MNNLTVRTISCVVFAAVMIGGILFNSVAYGALFLVIMSVAMQEFMTVCMEGRYVFQQKMSVFAAACFFVTLLCHSVYGIDLRWSCIALVPIMAIPVSVVFRKEHAVFENISYCYAALLYIGVPLTLSQFLVFRNDGTFSGTVLLSVFILVWMCDVGAYCLGSALGQRPGARKLAPAISPKKSWWGVAGGVTLGVLASYVLALVGWLPFGMVHCLALGVLVSFAGICGDLVESLWKRSFGVKDSGNIIPGHGGMLDRFDSSLMAIPVAFVYLTIAGLI